MKQLVLFLALGGLYLYSFPSKSIPTCQQIVFQNQTPHTLYLVENKNYKALQPQEGMIVGWKKSLNQQPRTITVYYGGKGISQKTRTTKPTKLSPHTKPLELAIINVTKPGTISFYYNDHGSFTYHHNLENKQKGTIA